MNKLYFLTFVSVAILLSGAAFLSQVRVSDDNTELLQSGLVTKRQWNDCVSQKVGIACNDAPNKVHTHCYDSIIDTNNCLLLSTPAACAAFNQFFYDTTNLDATLPQSFVDCVQACDTFAQQDTYFYRWYNLKYRTCSQL